MYFLSDRRGFTLVELMMCIAVIGILTALAVPSLRGYIIRTQLADIYQEINTCRLPYQILVHQGANPLAFTIQNLNIPQNTQYCQYTVTPPQAHGDTIDAIRCNIRNIPTLSGEHISLNRKEDSSWECVATSGIPVGYLPQLCQ